MVTILTGSQVIDAGVDWITATAKGVEQCEALIGIATSEIENKEASGFFGLKSGFQGYTGFGVEGCWYGTRADGVCLRATGNTAHRLADDIARVQVHISRLDVQATVQFDVDRKELANEFISEWRANTRGTHLSAQRHNQLVDADSNGSSAYIGRRSAAWFGRCYDKARESVGEYPIGAWRVETELKRNLAGLTFSQLRERDFSREAVIGMLKAGWYKRGIILDIPGGLEVDEPVIPRVKPDVERQLEWLRSTARPVVMRLCALGYEAQVADALYGWLMTHEGKGDKPDD